jgi:BlaI family transcriptional regulator, penicillinase repressor
MRELPQISDAEWQVMKVLWEHAPATANDLHEQLAPVTQWHLKTIRTMLTRLARKGAVAAKMIDGVSHYSALVSREECTRDAAQSFMHRVFDGALAPMVAHLISRQALSEEEKRELRSLLERSRKGEKK